LPENGPGFPSSAPPSKSFSTPGSTALKSAETSVQQTAEPSTITSVIVVPATSSRWDTITSTTQPTSTLSTPVVLTTTNSVGSQVVTTPPLVTIWTTSTAGDGTLFTATAVVENLPQADLSSVTGILHNTGAVAGIFSVVGVVFAILVVSLVICLRRRRKTHQRKKWLAEMQAQQPRSFADDPFRDDNLPPTMRTVHTHAEDDPWDRKGFLTPEDSGTNHGHLTFGQTKASIFPVYPISKDNTYSQPEIHRQSIYMESPVDSNNPHRHSLAPSTPSIYPASFQDEDKDIVIVPNFNQSATTSNLPPRPPRSHLRERSSKVYGSSLPIPSESEHSNHTNMVSEQRYRDYARVFDRKTILDVQSRPITQ